MIGVNRQRVAVANTSLFEPHQVSEADAPFVKCICLAWILGPEVRRGDFQRVIIGKKRFLETFLPLQDIAKFDPCIDEVRL
ncbi:hypothetical protein GALL_506570 [mine drainage metagenome]|uniref:Uncharacterized protein n=1 Tax=mine drainage metagenome TaxID=410659 RepID=A0A1J5P988_9ZZZZ